MAGRVCAAAAGKQICAKEQSLGLCLTIEKQNCMLQ